MCSAPSSPHIMSAQSVTSVSIEVVWKAPTRINGPPSDIKYYVKHRQSALSQTNSSPLLSVLQYKIIDLLPDKTYMIHIIAVNVDNGRRLESGASNEVNVTTQRAGVCCFGLLICIVIS